MTRIAGRRAHAPKEIVREAAAGTRLIEIQHELGHRHTVSRYAIVVAGEPLRRDFTALRKARAAFRAQIAGASLDGSKGH